jgi:hypothetical protein
VERAATATVASFTPNEVEVRVEGAEPGDHLVLNQNWDPGWTADGVPAIALHDAVATRPPGERASGSSSATGRRSVAWPGRPAR